MAIKSSLLNKTVNVERITVSPDNTGDISNSRSVSSTAIKMRITRNKQYASNNLSLKEYGAIVTSSHVGFCQVGSDIEVGDYIIDSTEEYFVNYVDDKPGGTSNHMQIYMTQTNVEIS